MSELMYNDIIVDKYIASWDTTYSAVFLCINIRTYIQK